MCTLFRLFGCLLISETTITDAAIGEMPVEKAGSVTAVVQQAEIVTEKAEITTGVTEVAANMAILEATQANVTAEVLQQTNINGEIY